MTSILPRARAWAGLFLCLGLAGCASLQRRPAAPRGTTAELGLEPTLPLAGLTASAALAKLSEGLAADMANEPVQAAAAYRAALALDPDNRDLARFIVRQLAKTRQFNEALAVATEAQKRWPAAAEPWIWESELHLVQRRANRAEAALRTAIEREPGLLGPRLDLSRLLFAAEKFEEAEAVLRDAAARHPGNDLPLRFLADVFAAREPRMAEGPDRRAYRERSLATLMEAVPRFPQATPLQAQAARILIALDRFPEAVDMCKRVEQTRPDDLEAKVQLAGLLLRAAGGRDEAIARLRAYNQDRPGDAITLMYEGLLVETGKDPLPAIAIYRRAIEGRPAQVTAFQKLAASLIETNALADARAVLEQGLAKFPGHIRLREWRAYLLMGEEKFEEAYAVFKEVEPERRRQIETLSDEGLREKETRQFASLQLQYALAAQTVGDFDAVPRLLKEGIRPNPALLAAFTRHVGKIDQKGERMGDAVRSLEALGRLLPAEPQVFLHLAVAQQAAKRHEAAVASFARTRRLAEASGEPQKVLNAYYHFHHGSALERTARLDEAEKAFRECIRLAPNFVEARNYLAYMWAERALRLTEALEMIEIALREEPENPAYLDTRGWIRYQQGDYAAARRDIEAALAKPEMGEDAELLTHLGDVHWMMGQASRAREAWEKALRHEPDRESARMRLAWPEPGAGFPSELLPAAGD